MFLALDIGNSDTKAGLHDGAGWVRTTRFPTPRGGAAALQAWAEGARVDGAGLASVVPARTAAWAEAVRGGLGVTAEVVHVGRPLPFRLAYETPETLGADRLAAAAAAWHRFGHDEQGRPRPVVALDAGTAVTTEVITGEGVYLGGAIAPGAPLLQRALSTQTAQLPAVDWPEAPSPIGASTRSAIQGGLGVLFLDGVRGLLVRTAGALGARPFVVATGGWAGWLAERLDGVDAVEPHLVLDGVRLLTAPR
ncbi:MAG TPA: type III pantothenate kinase [Anaeromyxobacteraceae bacterium]|nr:type III pantothenate kinase [Anaeromyxobacteraceae bacterium]